MKKKVVMFVLAIALVCSLTGCINLDMNEKISKNGKIVNSMVSYINKDAMKDYIVRKLGSDHVSEVEKELLGDGYSIKSIDGKEYYVSKPEISRTTIAKQAKQNQLETIKGGYEVWETGMRVRLDKVQSLDNADIAEQYELKENEVKDIMNESYFEYSAEFDYNVVKANQNGVIDSQNPKKVTWKIKLSELNKAKTLEAYCKSNIKVSGVIQGATYRKAKKVKFSGVKSAQYKGKKIKSGAKFKKHGQHTLTLKAADGEQRTVTFFIDKKKPIIKGIKNKKTYKETQYFMASDKDSGVASVTVNGKKQKAEYDMYVASKKGTNRIVVKDKAGNVKRINIKISKKKRKK